MTTATDSTNWSQAACVSIGIFAWNEERALARTLDSLFEQSIFARLQQRNWRCEVICVANGCTDRTPRLAAEIFEEHKRAHPHARAFVGRVADLAERGKVNAWNQFVHTLSAASAQCLFLMDADIILHRQDTLWNMLATLRSDPQAAVTVDRPCKDILFRARRGLRDRLSLAASQMTLAAEGQLCGQLYCIRAEVARNIFLPKDLAACEDGFIKALVCTDFLTQPVSPRRIRLADGAEHTFEAYTSPAAILRNQKRQMIGQTIVHLLVDDYLKSLPLPERERMAQSLQARETADPAWLKRLIRDHLQRTRFFWRLYPGLLGQRLTRLKKLNGFQRLTCLPAAAAGLGTALLSSFLAWQTLKAGCTNYWPKAKRTA